MASVKKIVYLAGPTASGKSAMAVRLAGWLQTGVVSADSRQFYQEMPIATAVIPEAERGGIPHFFLEFLRPDQEYSAGRFESEALAFATEWFQRHDVLLVTGGSGLYARAFLHGFSEMPETDLGIRAAVQQILEERGLEVLQRELQEKDPVTWKSMDIHNPRRVSRAIELIRQTGKPLGALQAAGAQPRPFSVVTVGIERPREELYSRIDARVLEMMDNGLPQEAESLLQKGYSQELSSLRAVGFPEMFAWLQGKLSRKEAIQKIQQHTRNYAKRQMTWLRKEPGIVWFRAEDEMSIQHYIREHLDIV